MSTFDEVTRRNSPLQELIQLQDRLKKLEFVAQEAKSFLTKIDKIMGRVEGITAFVYTHCYRWPEGKEWNIVDEQEGLELALAKLEEISDERYNQHKT